MESLICSWFDVENPEGSANAGKVYITFVSNIFFIFQDINNLLNFISFLFHLEQENGNVGEMSSSSFAKEEFSKQGINEGTFNSVPNIIEERRRSGAQMSEKLSNVSSEDIAMRSAGM